MRSSKLVRISKKHLPLYLEAQRIREQYAKKGFEKPLFDIIIELTRQPEKRKDEREKFVL